MFRAFLALLLYAPPLLAQEKSPHEGWVVLPVDEYKLLRSKAYPPERDADLAPVDATLSRMDYELKLTGDSASGQARLSVDVLKDGWVKVPIPADLLVREAKVDGRPITLVKGPSGPKPGSTPYVLLSRPGRYVLTLEVAVPLSASAGTETVTLPPSASALSRAEILLPRQGVDVTVSGGFLAEKTEAGPGTRCVAYGRSGQALVFSWRRRLEEKKTTLPLRLRGRIVEVVGLGEDIAQLTAEAALEVVQGTTPAVTLALPEGLAVNQVSGGLVGDWEVRGGALTVSFLEPLGSAASLVVSGEMKLPREGLVPIPLLRLPDAERETGGVAVEVLGEGELKDRQMKGMQDAAPTDLGGSVASRESPSLVAFKYHLLSGKEPRSLAVTVSRYAAQAVIPVNVEESRYRVLVGEEGKALVEARWAVRNNQRAFLTVALPEGATLWSAAVSGRPVRPGTALDGALLMPLEKATSLEEAVPFVVEIVYLQRLPSWAEKGETRLALPRLDVQVSRTGLELHHSPRFHLEPSPGPFHLEPYAEPLSAALQAFFPTPASPPQLEASKTQDEHASAIQGMVDRLEKEGRGKRVVGVLPVAVPFPKFGPRVFLASELTPQGSAPALTLTYRRTRR